MQAFFFILFAALLSNCGIKSSQGLKLTQGQHFPDLHHTYRPGQDTGYTEKYANKALYDTGNIVLTYDDGPHPVYTAQVLDAFQEFNRREGTNYKATFFINTIKVNTKNRYLIKRILQEGHLLASHDHDHTNNNQETESQHRRHLKQTIILLDQYLQEFKPTQKEIYFRYPYGAYGLSSSYHHLEVMKEISQQLFQENCINFVFWDFHANDWAYDMTGKDILQNLRANMEGGKEYGSKKAPGGRYRKFLKPTTRKGGGIMLLHDTHAKTVEATKLMLKYIKQKEYQVIPLSTVENYIFDNKRCDLSKRN